MPCRTFTTARGETVEIQDLGVCRYSVRSLVMGGTPWDFVRLFVGIPLEAIFSLSLRTLVLVLAEADRAQVRAAIG